MHDLTELSIALGKLPLEYLAFFVSLAGLGVAALAIYALYSIVKDRGRR